MLGFCVQSSLYIVVDFDGRFRMVRTIKRANADDKCKVVSPRDPFSAAHLESTPAEFTCSRGPRRELNPAAQRLERHPVDALPPNPNRDPVPRRLYLKQSDFMAYGDVRSLSKLQSISQWWPCTGHTEECRIRVEGELRKIEEGKARLRAAASRVGDAPTGRALKRVRFAADRVEGDAETPEATSASAPSSLPAEDATTNSLPAHPSEAVLPASAVEVPDQEMSEGASSAPDGAVRLSMKRSSDCSHSESETKRLHTHHSTRDVVMLLYDPDVSRAVEQCGEVCRRKDTFLVGVNDWDSEFRDKLRACGSDGTTVACSSSGTTRELMSNESCLLDLPAAARNGNLQRKTTGKCVRQHKRCILGAVGLAKNSTQFCSIVPRWRRRTS